MCIVVIVAPPIIVGSMAVVFFVSQHVDYYHILYAEIPHVVSTTGPVGRVREGSPVSLSCSAQGQPLPSFSWFHNGVEITPNSMINIRQSTTGDNTTSVLTIESVSYREHHGYYMCAAINSEGEDNAVIQLVVKSEFI